MIGVVQGCVVTCTDPGRGTGAGPGSIEPSATRLANGLTHSDDRVGQAEGANVEREEVVALEVYVGSRSGACTPQPSKHHRPRSRERG